MVFSERSGQVTENLVVRRGRIRRDVLFVLGSIERIVYHQCTTVQVGAQYKRLFQDPVDDRSGFRLQRMVDKHFANEQMVGSRELGRFLQIDLVQSIDQSIQVRKVSI